MYCLDYAAVEYSGADAFSSKERCQRVAMAKASISMETVEKGAPSGIQKVNSGMAIFVLSYFKHPETKQMQCLLNGYGIFLHNICHLCHFCFAHASDIDTV